MKTKKIVIVSILTAFVLIILLACMTLFSVRKAEVSFSVSSDKDTSEVQTLLDGYVGKNLMFVDTEDIKSQLSKYSYLEVVSIEKAYPNVLKVNLKERREIYYLEKDGQVFVTNEDGFVLKTAELSLLENSRAVIKLNLSGVNITELAVGKQMVTDSDELMLSVFEMAKSARLTDCIKEITLLKLAASEPADVNFITYTGVTICVQKAEIEGVEKIQAAFEVYDKNIGDYEKAFDMLFVSKNSESGEIRVTWSDGTEVE